MTTFALTYGDNPWESIGTKTRAWYEPILLDVYRARNIYTKFIPHAVDLRGRETNQITFTQMYDLEPDTDSIGLRDMWLPAQQTDSNARTITTEHHAGKVALFKYDDYINYWRRNPGRAGLEPIIRNLLAQSIADHMDILARNAFATGEYKSYCGNASDFGSIEAADLFDIDVLDDIWLGMSYREVPFANNPAGATGDVIAITSPGVLHDIRTQADSEWMSKAEYAGDLGRMLLNMEVGRVRATRFLQSTRATLFNCGEITAQTTITASASAGDGAYATVDGNVTPGQADSTRYIQVADASGFVGKENQIVAIHATRTSDYGVTNGVDFTEGSLSYRRLVNVNTSTNRLAFDRPLQKDYDTDLGSGVYGYVTLARHIHSTIVLGGSEGVVSGVTQVPTLHQPPTVDDVMGMRRFSWDAYIKFQQFKSDMFEVIFSAGNVRIKGDKSTGG